MLPGVAVALFVQQTEPLARGAADDDIRLGDFVYPMFRNLQNVVGSTMVADIGVVGLGGLGVEVVGPDGLKHLAE